MGKTTDILDLILCHKWYDMIESGQKTEEYRELSDYWQRRLGKYTYNFVRFHRGYTTRTMLFEFRLKQGIGRPEWGAPDYPVYILKLGKLVGV